MNIRKAVSEDLDAVEKIYEEIHTAQEEQRRKTGWIRGAHPAPATARDAIEHGCGELHLIRTFPIS